MAMRFPCEGLDATELPEGDGRSPEIVREYCADTRPCGGPVSYSRRSPGRLRRAVACARRRADAACGGGSSGDGPNAVLDPWCLIELEGDDEVLFGYALRHPSTGGLSWLTSSPVVWLDEVAGRAVTRSGRRYGLGRRMEPHEIPSEGEEPWMAYDILLRGDAADEEAVPPFSADPAADHRWLASQKMARHLGVAAPGRDPREVHAFIKRHLMSYVAQRAARGRA